MGLFWSGTVSSWHTLAQYAEIYHTQPQSSITLCLWLAVLHHVMNSTFCFCFKTRQWTMISRPEWRKVFLVTGKGFNGRCSNASGRRPISRQRWEVLTHQHNVPTDGTGTLPLVLHPLIDALKMKTPSPTKHKRHNKPAHFPAVWESYFTCK